VETDERGFRVAVVADELVNPGPDTFDALAVLEPLGWGVIQLPPPWYPHDVAVPLLEQVAEHVEEFARHGYDVVLVGARDGLADALAAARAPLPEAIEPASADELEAFLAAR
jgi:hypothetical protein